MSTETLADKPACFHPRGDVQHTRMDTRAVKDGQSAGALDTALEHAFGGTKETVKSVVSASFHYTSNYVDGAARTMLVADGTFTGREFQANDDTDADAKSAALRR